MRISNKLLKGGNMMEKAIKVLICCLGLFVTYSAIHLIVTEKFDYLKLQNNFSSTHTAKERERQLGCLAQNIYYEAGSEPFEGKVAIAQVVMNRAQSGKFPPDLCEVVYQKNTIMGKIICQFSWYCESSGHITARNKENYDESMIAAKKVLLEDYKLPDLDDALYFHADNIDPHWGKPKIVKIGHHIFYKDS